MSSRFARAHALAKRLGMDHLELSQAARANFGVASLKSLGDAQLGELEEMLARLVQRRHTGTRRPERKRFRPETILIEGVEVALATQPQINRLLALKDHHWPGEAEHVRRARLYEAVSRTVPRVRGAKNPLDALTRLEARDCIRNLESALKRRPTRKGLYGYG